VTSLFSTKKSVTLHLPCVRDVAELLSIQRVFQAINDCLCARHCLRFSESYPIFMRVRRYRSAERTESTHQHNSL